MLIKSLNEINEIYIFFLLFFLYIVFLLLKRKRLLFNYKFKNKYL